MKKASAWFLIVSLIFGGHLPQALADDSDIFGANVKPNVMLAITSATNMDIPIKSEPYAAGTTYPTSTPNYDTTKVYKYVNSTPLCKPGSPPCYLVYKNSIAQVPDADSPAAPGAARTALSTGGYWNGTIGGTAVSLYYGNYLNYTLCTTCGTNQPKIDIMKTVLTNLITNTSGVRFGAMKYAAGGGKIMEEIKDMTAANQATLINTIQTMTNQSSGNPIGDQMKSAGDYYEGHLTGVPSPIEYSCQPNFVIVLTDDVAGGSTDPRLEATALFTQDHNGTYSGVQNIVVHVIAFALPDDAAKPGKVQILKDTAKNGGGSYYEAFNAADLEKALNAAISQVLNSTYSFATPVVPTTGTSGAQRAYLASFQSNPSHPFWKGFLKAYNRDSNGLIQVDANGIPLASALQWDAGQQLSTMTASSRNIYTVISNTRQDFSTSNASITPGMMNAATGTEKNDIIQFIRGVDTYDEDDDTVTNEERNWKLGDIFHSTPALVTPPFMVSMDSSYNAFKTTSSVASRPTILLTGANDGIMHAIRESDGAELWGLIPPDLLGDLKDLTATIGQHDFYVDGSPVVADVKIGATPTWKTVAVSGLRRGGRKYYALDITDTTNPAYLWSFADSTKLGETWSEPAIGKVTISGADKWVAFVGGGYDTAQNNNTGKAFFVIDLSDGSKLWEYYNPGGVTDDRKYMNFSLAANPSAVDLDHNGYIDHVYIGDVGGQLWKFDVSTGNTSTWTGKRVFAAAPTQANPPTTGEYYPAQGIYAPPALAYDSAMKLWIFFGTGDRNHPMNKPSTNRFYGFKDDPNDMANGNLLTESSLTDLTLGTGTVTQGWYIVLANTEKVLASADVFNKIILFTTFTPTTVVTCGAGGGTAKLYSVNMTTGDAALNLTDGSLLTGGQSALANAASIGTGIPSRPVIVMNTSGGQFTIWAVTGTTDQQITNTQLPSPAALKQLVGWREVFQ
jgi:type IV pilus assembly protein PilY1